MIPRVLVISGSDPLAYSGLEADLRHLEVFGVEGLGVPSAMTRQSADRVLGVEGVATGDVRAGIRGALASGGAAVKLGMLHSAAIVDAVVTELAGITIPIICDPVLGSSGGASLLDEAGQEALERHLLPCVSLLTPNLPELSALVPDRTDRIIAARSLIQRGVGGVLVKGGHGGGATVEDTLVTSTSERSWTSSRVAGAAPRGTGCALATAITAGLASGRGLHDAIAVAHTLVGRAISKCAERGTRFLVLDQTDLDRAESPERSRPSG